MTKSKLGIEYISHVIASVAKQSSLVLGELWIATVATLPRDDEEIDSGSRSLLAAWPE